MFENPNIAAVHILKLPDGTFALQWDYINPTEDGAGGQCTVDSIVEVIAHLVDPYQTKIGWDRVERLSLLLHASWLEPEWQFLDEYAARQGVTRQTIYDRIKEGKLEMSKLGRFTLVRPASK